MRDRRLPRSARLADAKTFQRLLQQRKRIEDCIELSILRHGQSSPRLGLVVSARFLPRAVDRNAFKRIVREAFRLQRGELPAADMLVRLRQSLKTEPRTAWKPRVVVAVRTLFAAAAR